MKRIRLMGTNASGLIIVLLATLALYLPSLANTPVFDDRLLTSGELFATYGSFAELKPRLLSYGSFVWVQDLFGSGWWKQRVVNLLIHLSVVGALWGLYRQIAVFFTPPEHEDGSPGRAYIDSPALILAIGAYALNPVAVYAVAYLIQRSILLATLFVVLSLWMFVRGLVFQRAGLYAAALLFYGLAVMSKEHALMAPLAAIPLYIVVKRPSMRKLAVLGGVCALLAISVALLLSIRYGDIIGKPFDEYSRIYLEQLTALGPDVDKNAYGLSIVNQAYFFFKYGFHWYVPYSGWLSIDLRPPFPVSFFAFPQLLGLTGYLAVIAGGLLLVTRYRDWRALAGLSFLMPALLFLTEFSTVWVQDPFVLYRSYLWAVGIPGIVLLLFNDLKDRTALVVGVLLGVLLVWQALDRIGSLATPEKVWSDAVAKLPDDARSVGRWFPHLNLAETYLDQNRLNEAYRHFKYSSSLGDQGTGMYNIGAMLGMVGKYADSLKALDEARQQGYNAFGLDYQRGVALFGLGQPRIAYEAFIAADEKQHPAGMEDRIALALGRTAKAMGDRVSAIKHFKRASELNPGDAAARVELGTLYVAQGDYQAAHEVFTRLLGENPMGPAYFGRALANHGLGNKPEAVSDIDNALRLGPDNPALREWQAKIRAMP